MDQIIQGFFLGMFVTLFILFLVLVTAKKQEKYPVKEDDPADWWKKEPKEPSGE